jgi:hypothetical protein
MHPCVRHTEPMSGPTYRTAAEAGRAHLISLPGTAIRTHQAETARGQERDKGRSRMRQGSSQPYTRASRRRTVYLPTGLGRGRRTDTTRSGTDGCRGSHAARCVWSDRAVCRMAVVVEASVDRIRARRYGASRRATGQQPPQSLMAVAGRAARESPPLRQAERWCRSRVRRHSARAARRFADDPAHERARRDAFHTDCLSW